MPKNKALIILLALFAGILVAVICEPIRTQMNYLMVKFRGGYTTDERLQQFGRDVSERMNADFKKAEISYPPEQVAYLIFKDTDVLEVYARSLTSEKWKFVRSYPVLKASGLPGPKLREGDFQVPEGIYRSEFLNPNSRYHLSIRVNYPNEFDREMAKVDGRDDLGGDIMIHGSSVSIGCLVMGNIVAEDLFVLAALTDSKTVKIVISPTDFRINPNYSAIETVPWQNQLYDSLRVELKQFNR